MQRHALKDGTVLSVQQPAGAHSAGQSLALLFDGRPMIDAGIPEMMRSLQEDRIIGPLTTVYVESIRGSTVRGPSRVASLTDPVLLATLVQTLRQFLELSGVVTAEPQRRVVMGHSLGGNAALHVASRWPASSPDPPPPPPHCGGPVTRCSCPEARSRPRSRRCRGFVCG